MCFMLLLVVALLSLGGRCLYLQHFRSGHYTGLSDKQHRSWVTKQPQRGAILDCYSRILAASNRKQSIFVEPRVVKEPKETSTRLAPIVDMGAHIICKLITESRNPGFVRIKAGAEPHECDAARKIYGVGVESGWCRDYPVGALAAHIVGFTSRDNRGLGGIELQFDRQLAGSAGRDVFLADAARRPIKLKEQASLVTNGTGIILTIDTTIQQFARTELLKQYKEFEAESAVAVIAEPETGAILAMVSLPDFDPAKAHLTDPANFRNRAVTDQFEPGSILKPIAAAIAIDCGAVGRNEKIFCEYGNYHGKGFGRIGEYGDHEFGDLSIREILIKSSNIGMAKIGQKVGKKRLYTYLRLFGFGKPTGIEIPGEVSGMFWPVSKWTGYSVTRIPFGQEISATAMQLVRAFCILANGGHSVRPHLVKAMVDSDGNVINLKRPGRAGVGYVIKPDVAKWIVTDALVGVVNEKKNGGTGWRAKLEKWQVFGKTGTANIPKSDERGYSDSDYVASFIAGAPAEDPQIVILVSVRKPNRRLGKGYTGGAVASGVAGRIIEKTLTYLERKQQQATGSYFASGAK